jgi:hypothetical protein
MTRLELLEGWLLGCSPICCTPHNIGHDDGKWLVAMLREAERLPKSQGVCHYCCDCEASLCQHPRDKCGWCAWEAKLREVRLGGQTVGGSVMRNDPIVTLRNMERGTHDFALTLAERLRIVEQKVAQLERATYGQCKECGQQRKPEV